MLIPLQLDQDPVSQLLGSSSEERIDGDGDASHALPWRLLYYSSPSRLLQKAGRLARSDQRRAQGFLLRYGPLTTRSMGSCIYPRIRTAAPEQMSMLLSVMGTARSPAAITGWLHSHRQMPLRQVIERENPSQLWESHCGLLSFFGSSGSYRRLRLNFAYVPMNHADARGILTQSR